MSTSADLSVSTSSQLLFYVVELSQLSGIVADELWHCHVICVELFILGHNLNSALLQEIKLLIVWAENVRLDFFSLGSLY